MDFQVSPRC